MSKPRVTAHNEVRPITRERANGNIYQPPSVTVTVDFTLGDHDHALRQLEDAVADVRAQIEGTR